MSIYSGPTKLFDVNAGGVDVKEIYVGATKVFPEALPTVTLAATTLTFPLAGGTVALTATPGGAGPFEYHWQEFVPGGEFLTYEVTASATSSRAITVSGTQYRVVIRDAYYPTNAQVISNALTGTLVGPETVTLTVDVNPITEGQVATFTVTGSANGQPATQFTFLQSPDSATWTTVQDGASNTFAYTAILGDPVGAVFIANCYDSLGQFTQTLTVTLSVVSAFAGTMTYIGQRLATSSGNWDGFQQNIPVGTEPPAGSIRTILVVLDTVTNSAPAINVFHIAGIAVTVHADIISTSGGFTNRTIIGTIQLPTGTADVDMQLWFTNGTDYFGFAWSYYHLIDYSSFKEVITSAAVLAEPVKTVVNNGVTLAPHVAGMLTGSGRNVVTPALSATGATLTLDVNNYDMGTTEFVSHGSYTGANLAAAVTGTYSSSSNAQSHLVGIVFGDTPATEVAGEAVDTTRPTGVTSPPIEEDN